MSAPPLIFSLRWWRVVWLILRERFGDPPQREIGLGLVPGRVAELDTEAKDIPR
jgi:hypothetical protein